MNGMHIEALKPTMEEGDHSRVASLVSKVFSHELSGIKWKEYTKESLLTLLSEKAEELRIPEGDIHYQLLLRSLKKPKRIEECLEAMTTFLLGKGF